MPTLDLGNVVGPQGQQGPPGPQGAQGTQGPPGPAGANPYDYAAAGGYAGTEAEFQDMLAKMGEAPEKLMLPLAEGWFNHPAGGSDGHCYRKTADGFVTLTLDLMYKEETTGTKTVGILPEGYRPAAMINATGCDMGRMLPISLSVTADGKISLLPMRNSGVHPKDIVYRYFIGSISFYAG